MSKTNRRFQRQFDALTRHFPRLGVLLQALHVGRWRILRLPLALIFLVGGVFSFLPVLGVWMIPLGLLLLAVDLPFLRGPISGLIIRARRRGSLWFRCLRARRRGA